ncbi:uncharacterized protein LOC134824208 isoform X1 [Bolinopsis microptera]|uniref:uncharacterized protein LOC134824208 isoform X1 n=1 Tax=Bolinopsis microptera TaxID=2820187 RepID=UPI00307A258D
MRVLLIGLSLTLVCFLAVKADDDADADAALDERDQVFQRGKYFDSKKKLKGAGGKMKKMQVAKLAKGRKGEVELEEEVLVERADEFESWVKRLEDEIDNIQVEEESDIDTEKREQGWKTYGKIKKGEEEVLELEKRQMNPSNKGFNKFGNGKFGGRFGKSRAGN